MNFTYFKAAKTVQPTLALFFVFNTKWISRIYFELFETSSNMRRSRRSGGQTIEIQSASILFEWNFSVDSAFSWKDSSCLRSLLSLDTLYGLKSGPQAKLCMQNSKKIQKRQNRSPFWKYGILHGWTVKRQCCCCNNDMSFRHFYLFYTDIIKV